MEPEFIKFPSIPRLSRECFVTEKINGTNGTIYINDAGEIYAASKNKFLYHNRSKGDDNYGFAGWVERNKEEILKLGVGRHSGEFAGSGIQSGYNLKEKHFYLFNVGKWSDDSIRPKCCDVVPILYHGVFSTEEVDKALEYLKTNGSVISPGFMNPEGVIVFHVAANQFFKKTLHNNDGGKWQKAKKA